MCLREQSTELNKCDCGVVGNARPCQGRDRGFEPRLSLLKKDIHLDILFLNLNHWGRGMSIIGITRGLLSIHCAALADENGAVLISGSSGSGKSTVTTRLLSQGYRLVANVMQFAGQKENRTTYWKLPKHKSGEDLSAKDAICNFMSIYEKCVLDATRTKGKRGITLSGGLDSSSLAALATKILK